MRGCFTGHIASLGHAVLVFSDVRDSLFALQVIECDLDFSAALFASARPLARCITPQAFEQVSLVGSLGAVDDLPNPRMLFAACVRQQLAGSVEQNPLISASEGVIVATFRGPQAAVSPASTFATFGEIRSLKSVDRMTFGVEYWDDRAAEAALKQLGGRRTGAVRLECTFEPSIAVRCLR